MIVIQDNIWLCSDCTQVACNGTSGIKLLDAKATIEGLSKLGQHLVPDFDSESGDGLEEFSNRMCESCKEWRAGYRAQFVILGEEEAQ